MKNLLLILFLAFAVTASYSQTTSEPREFYNDEFSWRINIPAGYSTLTAEQLAAAQKKGADAIEKATDVEVANKAKVILAIRSNQFNYFESNWQPFEGEFANYPNQCEQVNALLYQTFKSQLPNAPLDSSSSTETISGLAFRAFHLSIHLPNGVIMEMRMYSRLFGRKEFTVNILSTDKKKEEELLGAWRSSIFEATKINERRIK